MKKTEKALVTTTDTDKKPVRKAKTGMVVASQAGTKDLAAILSQTSTGIQNEVIEAGQQVKEASKDLLEVTQYGELEEAAIIVGTMSKELKKLNPSIWDHIPFLGGRVEKKILARKSVKEVLEQVMENYRTVANSLRGNVDRVLVIEEAAVACADALETAIERLETEKEILENAIQKWDKDDTRGLASAQDKLRMYNASINNAATFLTTQRHTIIECGVQCQTRGMLYNTMTALAPQVETLANQQLAMIISQNEVAMAVKINTAAIESVRNAVVINAKMMRQNAKDVAVAAYSPIVDEKTLQASKNEILGMITEVNQAIETALAEGTRAAKAARESEKEIEQAIARSIRGENVKTLPKPKGGK
jgi:uncharacterized protein YaaN involved in tellurite resistance